VSAAAAVVGVGREGEDEARAAGATVTVARPLTGAEIRRFLISELAQPDATLSATGRPLPPMCWWPRHPVNREVVTAVLQSLDAAFPWPRMAARRLSDAVRSGSIWS
jgi:hypothetical protein